MMLPEFVPFPKIARLSREIIITEKLDGTNAQIHITEDGQVLAGSRTRWITPDNDNYGFAKWVERNKEELLKLGQGSHFGEWWGNGIQRGYGMKEKVFSLFNVSRWDPAFKGIEERPACCSVVPTLYVGPFSEEAILAQLDWLRENGSLAARKFMKPEGIVVFHTANSTLWKKTLEGDEKPKGSKE